MARADTQAGAGADTAAAGRGRRADARGRALVVGAIASALTAALVTQAEMVLGTIRIGYLQFPPAALGLLLVALGLSRLAARLSRRWSLTSPDLLVIYSMCLVAAMTSSHGLAQKLVPSLVYVPNHTDATNSLGTLYNRWIPPGLVPYDTALASKQRVADAWNNRLPAGAAIPWGAWVAPTLNWGLLCALVLSAFLCLTALLRRQWVDGERLAFPLAQLPLEIAGDQDRPAFFRNALMWLGFALPALVYAVKGLHQIQPSVPDVTLQWVLTDYVKAAPWNGAAANVLFIVSFAAIGFFYLLPTDILFSVWFFFLLTRVEQMVMISLNQPTPQMPAYPPTLFVGYQTVGAYCVLAAYFFWTARPHLGRVWAAAVGRGDGEDADELLPYRTAFWGLGACVLASALWLWGNGMSPWLALFELVVCLFVIGLVMARSTAEAGMLMTETTFRPVDLLRMVMPLHSLGPANLTMLAFFDNLFLRDQRGLLLTGMLDAARISDGLKAGDGPGVGVRRRSFARALALGIVIAFAVAVPLNIALPYRLGASGHMDYWMTQGSPGLTFTDYAQYFKGSPPPVAGASWQMPTFFGVGVAMTVFLSVMRSAFFWWPLHPLGYALSGSWSTIQFWFPCLLAWLFKSLTLRYGGMSFYARARPFFLGMVLGEFGIAVLYAVLNALSAWLTPEHKIPAPPFPWG